MRAAALNCKRRETMCQARQLMEVEQAEASLFLAAAFAQMCSTAFRGSERS
jgi:hypothetical protein